jgi:high-affinity iron transporter
MLIAAAVLFYVSYWLTSKAEAAKWMAYIQNQVIKSIGKGSVLTLGFASFIVVYREGAETILFYSALFSRASGSGGISIWGGFAVGCLFLVGVYYLFKYGTAKIPIRPFFNVTSLILYYMAFVFVGEGIVELQIGGLLRATPIDWIPRIGILGIHPTLESVTLQMVMLIAAFIALIYLFVVHPYRAQGRVLQDVSHTLKDLHNLHNKVEHIRAHASSGIRLTASNSNQEINKISEHLNEIDSSSHELLNHLESLRAELSSLLGNVENGGNAQKAQKG